MRKRYNIFPLLVIISALFVLTAVGFYYFESNHIAKSIPATTEREVKVSLDAGLGTIYLSKGSSSKILDADADIEKVNDLSDCISYSVKDDVGYLDINTGGNTEGKHDRKRDRSGIHIGHLESSTWRLQFTDAVPIAFDIEMGLGKADLDFSDLLVKDLTLSTGASSVTFRFDRPNKKVIQNLNLEAGLSKFRAEGLCNANFNHMKFSGGVGTYSLDFGGKLDKEVDVDIELGLGTLTITIPEEFGTKISYEKNWLSHFDVDKADFSEREENVYYSQNFRTASGRLNMHIEAGLGTVKIRRE